VSSESFLAALQLSDGALPIGRFVHSHGLEAWLRDHGRVSAERVAALVESAVCHGVAPLDGAVLAHAHGATSLPVLLSLDAALTARKLTPLTRDASHACGRQLAKLGPALATGDVLVAAHAGAVADGRADGNLAVVAGALARALGLSAEQALLVELRNAAAGLLSAAVRLGVLAPTRAQSLLAVMHPAIARAAEHALSVELADVHATIPELDAHVLTHARAHPRIFMS
jgi:urease accessory protein